MAIVMVSLNPTKTGELVARKVIPKDARAEYRRLHGVGREARLKIPAGTPKAQAKALHGQWLAPMRRNLLAIIASFEAAGVAFVQEDVEQGLGAGVRHRKLELEHKTEVSARTRSSRKPLIVCGPQRCG